jgi:hypothetical protein
MILSLEDFKNYYFKYKKLPNGLYCSDKNLNDKQLLTKYNKYCQSIEKQQIRSQIQFENKIIKNQEIIANNYQDLIDEKWVNLRNEIIQRANNKCEITPLLTKSELDFVNVNIYYNFEILDCIHVIARSQSKKLYYDKQNIIFGKRYYHTLIDNYKNPFTLKDISNEERNSLFIRFIGIDRWNYLQENK